MPGVKLHTHGSVSSVLSILPSPSHPWSLPSCSFMVLCLPYSSVYIINDNNDDNNDNNTNNNTLSD